MSRCLMISFTDLSHDGRTRELIDALSEKVKVDVICSSYPGHQDLDVGEVITFSNSRKKPSALNLLLFNIWALLNFLRYFRACNCIIIDNLYVAPLGLLVSLLSKKRIVYDMRELYVGKRVAKSLTKVLLRLELALAKRAQLLIVANVYRKTFLRRLLRHKHVIVFENVRFPSLNEGTVDRDYEDFVNKFEYVVLSTGGYSKSRGTLKVIHELNLLPQNIGVVFMGPGKDDLIKELGENLDVKKLKNRFLFMGVVPYRDLGYYINKCSIGLVFYPKHDLNNRLCASGKVYEFAFYNKPVASSNNLPLRNFIERNNIGLTGEDMGKVIIDVVLNYHSFRFDTNRLYGNNENTSLLKAVLRLL